MVSQTQSMFMRYIGHIIRGFAHPCKGFDFLSSAVASIWLIFLFPVLSSAVGTDKFFPAVTIILIFSLLYFFLFGSQDYYPRHCSEEQRFIGGLILLMVVVVSSLPILGLGTLFFFTYISSYIGFNAPPAIRSYQLILLCSLIIPSFVIAVYIASSRYLEISMLVIGSPLFIFLFSQFIHRTEEIQNLRHEYEMISQRENIAVDIHDLLGHSLTIINLKAELVARIVENNPDQARKEAQAIVDISRSALGEVRSTVTRMKDPSLAGELLAAARACQSAGIRLTIIGEEEIQTLPMQLNSLCAWVTREGITNVLRHSRANLCELTLFWKSDNKADDCAICVEHNCNFYLKITDDGQGFSMEEYPKNTSGGLGDLERRVQQAGGELNVDSEPHKGTGIVLRVPMTHSGHNGVPISRRGEQK